MYTVAQSIQEFCSVFQIVVNKDWDILVLGDRIEEVDSSIDERKPRNRLYHSTANILEFPHILQMELSPKIRVNFDEITGQPDLRP